MTQRNVQKQSLASEKSGLRQSRDWNVFARALITFLKHPRIPLSNGATPPKSSVHATRIFLRLACLTFRKVCGLHGRARPCNPQTFLKVKQANLKNIRVAWTEDFGGVAPLDNGIRGCFRKVISALANTFQSLDCRNPDFSDARDCFWTLRCVNYLAS